MSILYLLVRLALLLAFGSVLAFRWATKNEQFDDLDSPAIRMLEDDASPIDDSV